MTAHRATPQNAIVSNFSPLGKGNKAFREREYTTAITHYLQAMQATPAIGKTIAFNVALVKKKYNETRLADRLRVAVCGWELAHNAAGRVYTLAKLYEPFANVEIIGPILSKFGNAIWEPIRKTTIPVHSFVMEDESFFFDKAIELIAKHPFDIVHLSKPRIHNIFFGILYKMIWDAKVLMDIDDEELAFVGAESPISLDEYLKIHGKLPELKGLAGKEWTRIAVGLAKEFDGITVSNPVLQERYSGSLICHARDEKCYQPSPELKFRSREKFGIQKDKKVVVFFGTPREHKGLLETADAIASLKRKDVVFAIVGDFPNPKLKAKLIKKRVEYCFIGNQPFNSIPEILSIGDFCLILQETGSQISHFQTPAKLTDALAMGLVVFTTKARTLYDLIKAGACVEVSINNIAASLDSYLNNHQAYATQQALAR